MKVGYCVVSAWLTSTDIGHGEVVQTLYQPEVADSIDDVSPPFPPSSMFHILFTATVCLDFNYLLIHLCPDFVIPCSGIRDA